MYVDIDYVIHSTPIENSLCQCCKVEKSFTDRKELNFNSVKTVKKNLHGPILLCAEKKNACSN